MNRGSYLDFRVFVEIYAAKINARLILASEMLRFETLGRADTDNLNTFHSLSYRIDFKGTIEIENPNKNKPSVFKIFSEKTVNEIKIALDNKKNVFIFSLRKGLATMSICRDCNEIIVCEKCGTPLVLYNSHKDTQRIFVCNRCQNEIGGKKVCANCGSWNLMPLGIGTDTVFEELTKIFPKVKIFKLDKEIAKTKSGAEKIIKEFEKCQGAILIGTEMAFFYLQEKVILSVIASFDSLWNIPNFKMSEKILQIIISTISNTNEKIIIQTKNENDDIIKALENENLLYFIRKELEDRKKLGYPPYKRFIKITYLSDKTEMLKAKNILGEIFKEYNPEIFSGFVARLKGKYVTNMLIKMDPKKWSLLELSANSKIDENLSAKLRSLPPAFKIFVDPEDLL